MSGRTYDYGSPVGLPTVGLAQATAALQPKSRGMGPPSKMSAAPVVPPPPKREDLVRAASAHLLSQLPISSSGPKAKSLAKTVQKAVTQALPKSMSVKAIAKAITKVHANDPAVVFVPVNSIAQAVHQVSNPQIPKALESLVLVLLSSNTMFPLVTAGLLGWSTWSMASR